MKLFTNLFATGLVDALSRHNFENIGNRQWDEMVMTIPWVFVCGEVAQTGDKYTAHVSTESIPGVYNNVGNKWVTIWRSREQKTYEEALGILTKNVRDSQLRFPHLIFLLAIYYSNNKPSCQEFLFNKWINHPKNLPSTNDWEPLRSVVKKCPICNYFEDGLDAYLDDGDDEKLFAYNYKVTQCRENFEFKCLLPKKSSGGVTP